MRDLLAFLRPLYQELDGVSRLDTVERLAAITRRLAPPSRELELLIFFHPLGNWLDKVGNLSRAVLTLRDVTADELRQTARSIRRLDAPESAAERAVAAALLIDNAGVRGLAERLARARREGNSIAEVARQSLDETPRPDWLDAQSAAWLRTRDDARARVANAVIAELALTDLDCMESSAT
jgi:hypothetical protein